jgi:hypothetical protein
MRGKQMKSRISETETKTREYTDHIENEINTSDESPSRLDLNVLLKRLKDQKDSDKKINLIVGSLMLVVSAVVALMIII